MTKLTRKTPDAVPFKDTKFFVCACPHCKEKQEIFSDELHKTHWCKKCGEVIDFSECSFEIP